MDAVPDRPSEGGGACSMSIFACIAAFFRRERAFAGAALEDAARCEMGGDGLISLADDPQRAFNERMSAQMCMRAARRDPLKAMG